MRDNRVEQWLTEQAVEWVYEEIVPLQNFDRERSLKNKGRMTALNDDAVERYTLDMKRGSQFPALIAFWDDKKKLILITGNNRLEAARRAGRTHLDAYCLDVEHPAVIERLTRTANNIEGVGIDADERMLHAIELVRNHGYVATTAAAECRISYDVLKDRLRADDVQRRLLRVGAADKASQVHSRTLSRMARVQSDVVLVALADLAADAKLSSSQVQTLVEDVLAAGSEERALTVLDLTRAAPHIQTQIQLTAGGRHPKPRAAQSPYQKLVRAMGTLRGVVVAARSLEDLGLGDPETREKVRVAWNDLVTVMGGKLYGHQSLSGTVERAANGAAAHSDPPGDGGRGAAVAGLGRG